MRARAVQERMAHMETCEALMARVAERDEEAVAELFARQAPKLMGIVARILPDRSVASAVVEDVFLRLWRDARRYPREGASVAAWLVVTTRRAAIEARRAERKLPAPGRGQSDLLIESFIWLPRPTEVALVDERRELLKKVLNQLPKPQRTTLEYVVYEGCTEEEIAARLGEPLGKVKSSLRAGMRFLRHRLRAVVGTWSASI